MKSTVIAILFATVVAGASCQTGSQQQQVKQAEPVMVTTPDTMAATKPVTKAEAATIHTDTLQFVEFDGNGDYYVATFIDRDGTLTSLYCDNDIDANLSGKLMRVTWQMDTFYAAGVGDTPYQGEQLLTYKILSSGAVRPYKTRAAMEEDVKALPIIKALQEASVYVESYPQTANGYYTVNVTAPVAPEGSTVTYNEHIYTFRVYQVPGYRIMMVDTATKKEIPVKNL